MKISQAYLVSTLLLSLSSTLGFAADSAVKFSLQMQLQPAYADIVSLTDIQNVGAMCEKIGGLHAILTGVSIGVQTGLYPQTQISSVDGYAAINQDLIVLLKKSGGLENDCFSTRSDADKLSVLTADIAQTQNALQSAIVDIAKQLGPTN